MTWCGCVSRYSFKGLGVTGSSFGFLHSLFYGAETISTLVISFVMTVLDDGLRNTYHDGKK